MLPSLPLALPSTEARMAAGSKAVFGLAALDDLSRRPHHSPYQTPEAVVDVLVKWRRRHPTWGRFTSLKPVNPGARANRSILLGPAASEPDAAETVQGLGRTVSICRFEEARVCLVVAPAAEGVPRAPCRTARRSARFFSPCDARNSISSIRAAKEQ